MGFCTQYAVNPVNPPVKVIMCYLEFLANKLKSPKSIVNYWAAVKLFHATVKSSFQNQEDIQVQHMLRAITLTKRHVSEQKLPLTKLHIQQMCNILDRMGPVGVVLKCAVLFGFYAFLRASNLCPESLRSYDTTRHFARRDVKVQAEGIVIALKWAKNLQTSLQPQAVPIPQVQPSEVDPVATFQRMCKMVPAAQHQPLFMLPNNQILTVNKFRDTFKWLCQKINIDSTKFSLHSLRRGGATCAHRQGADPMDIQRQGAWASATFWNYVASKPPHESSVCTVLSK